MSEEVLRGFFREMLLIRRFEEKVEERFRAGELPGFLHVAIGQEAAATVCALRSNAKTSSRRRTARTGTRSRRERRSTGSWPSSTGRSRASGGYGGSMHLYDLEVGNLGANAVVAGGLPAIVGAASPSRCGARSV